MIFIFLVFNIQVFVLMFIKVKFKLSVCYKARIKTFDKMIIVGLVVFFI